MAKLTESVRAMLTGGNFGHLATVMEDGSPHVSPVWIDCENDHVVINTAVGRRKERNMRRDPRVALSVVDQRNPYKELHVRGRVVEMVEGDEAWRHVDALNRRYHQTESQYPRRPGMDRVLVRIEPTVVHEVS
ncbi:MAG TPA: PPOX class F420-dependent oxidoreductase [Gaiellaceae bacterium]|nr:PPOX class F420-dependent oxidoreductase [Gaiellaceae bacterium]